VRCAAPVAGSGAGAPALPRAGAGARARRRLTPPARAALASLFLSLLGPVGAAPAAAPEQSWIKPRADQSVLVDIARAGGRWLVVGERGHVLLSDDGRDWRQVRVPSRVLLNAAAIGEDGLGFAVGHEATILRTRDHGESWERVFHAPEEQAPLLDVLMAGDGRVIAVGAYGMYVESTDGGQSWEQRVIEPQELAAAADAGSEAEFYYDYHLNDIAVAGDGRWYIAAEAGNIYRSDDAGETWLRLPSPYEGSFFGVLPLAGEQVLVFGLQGRLFRSGDAGARWTRIDTGTDATLATGLRLDDGRALIAGYAGIVLNRVDAGGGLTRVRLTNRPAVADAALLADGDLLTVGDQGVRVWPAAMLAGDSE